MLEDEKETKVDLVCPIERKLDGTIITVEVIFSELPSKEGLDRLRRYLALLQSAWDSDGPIVEKPARIVVAEPSPEEVGAAYAAAYAATYGETVKRTEAELVNALQRARDEIAALTGVDVSEEYTLLMDIDAVLKKMGVQSDANTQGE
jgi:hypothetical protein